LVQKAGASPERIEIVQPGCDIDWFRPTCPRMDLRHQFLGDRIKDKVVLSVGTLQARKGHDMVIRALPRLPQLVPGGTYLIVGEGPYRDVLEKVALELEVGDRVVFAGRVSAEELPDVYAISDVFVMPSREQTDKCDVEGFGLVFLEASACAKPVIGGRSGGVHDAIVDSVTGLLVNPRDPEDIANALAQLLRDEDLAVRLGQHGRAWITKKFDWSRVADQVHGILQGVLREKSVRSGSDYSPPMKKILEKPREVGPT